MKQEKLFYRMLVLLGIIFLFTYCDSNFVEYDNIPPDAPTGVETFVGDNLVEIQWEDNRERDVAGYNVYYSDSYWGDYELIGNTDNNYFVDYDAVNGELYYYGIAAYDFDGNESELSYDKIYGVARPEGLNQAIFDYLRFPDNSGYDFDEYLVVPFDANDNDQSADFFFENFEGTYYLNVWDDTDIQDMGFTESFLNVTYAPIDGWVPIVEGENVKYTEVEVGHTYVVWTWDNHYAKVRVNAILGERIIFDWAYQLLEGEPMLKTNRNSDKRNSLPNAVIKN